MRIVDAALAAALVGGGATFSLNEPVTDATEDDADDEPEADDDDDAEDEDEAVVLDGGDVRVG